LRLPIDCPIALVLDATTESVSEALPLDNSTELEREEALQ
jgi:hypothetical protein